MMYQSNHLAEFMFLLITNFYFSNIYFEKFIDNTKGDDDNGNNNTNLDGKSTDNTWLKIVSIIFLLIIFFVLGILFHKNIIRLHIFIICLLKQQ